MSGTVLLEGAPVADATVRLQVFLPDGTSDFVETATGTDGRFSVEAIPAGVDAIEAYKDIGIPPDSVLHSTDRCEAGVGDCDENGNVVVRAGETSNVTLVLAPPDVLLRRVLVVGTLDIIDEDVWEDVRELKSVEIELYPGPPGEEAAYMRVSGCAGGEVRLDLTVAAATVVTPNAAGVGVYEGRVKISLEARLWEGTSCDRDNLRTSKQYEIFVDPDQTQFVEDQLIWEGGDEAFWSLEITNARQE